MGYGIFSLFTAVISLVAYLLIRKGYTRIIAGNNGTNDTQSEQFLLKSYVLRILFSVTILQLTTGVVCLWGATTALLVSSLSCLIGFCLVGVILYEVETKTANSTLTKAHQILTVAFSVLAVVLLVLLRVL
jgi:hypothetical protein